MWMNFFAERLCYRVKRQSLYGKPEWHIKMSKKFGLKVTLRQRGRPKNEGRNGEKEPVSFYAPPICYLNEGQEVVITISIYGIRLSRDTVGRSLQS